nr:MAG TPA: hypothetical protein [Caudoviricetes sp.]DAJ77813.1 MAG TPA: hypothetical protein [Caudoviricetes sp.]
MRMLRFCRKVTREKLHLIHRLRYLAPYRFHWKHREN